MKQEIIHADVLCAGGGIAGLMAAIRAAELGAKVIVAEKGNTLRSGAGAMGNDHFMCYIPEVHGPDIKPIIQEFQHSQAAGLRDADFIRAWLEKSFDIVKMWDSWGIPMKYNGNWEFAGHGFPGHPLMWLKYSGQDQKRILTGEAIKRGVVIKNRIMISDLFFNSGIIGAIGADTREDRIMEFQCKSVVLGTGGCERLYPGITPAWMFNLNMAPNNTGDGRAIAYRAGAELVSMEIPMRWAGPKYFARSGKGTWVSVIRDPQGKAAGPFVDKPDRRYGDIAADVWPTLFEDYFKSGKGPVYMDCGGITDKDYQYMVYWLQQEGNTSLLDYFEREGIDPRKNPVEFTTYGMTLRGGPWVDAGAGTSIKGLYAAGDEFGAGISGAATFGWIAGDNAARYSMGIPSFNMEKHNIEENTNLIAEFRRRESGIGWKEFNIALQQIMYDYAGLVRSETLLEAGLTHLRRLKAKAHSEIMARNQHELMHCLEVLNLIDLGELVFITARERKETRGRHIRPDYPFTNPMLEKQLVIRKADGKPVTEWKPLKR